MIRNVKIFIFNYIIKIDEYDKVGSNASMVVEPAIVKFAGFEILKLNVMKVKVINKSPHP